MNDFTIPEIRYPERVSGNAIKTSSLYNNVFTCLYISGSKLRFFCLKSIIFDFAFLIFGLPFPVFLEAHFIRLYFVVSFHLLPTQYSRFFVLFWWTGPFISSNNSSEKSNDCWMFLNAVYGLRSNYFGAILPQIFAESMM